jgi:putative membrane protein
VPRSLTPVSVYLRGLAMGAADVVPGVSGGTVALLLGIYERLVAALRGATGLAPWRALGAGDLRAAWRAADGVFLLPLVLGIATSVVLLARLVEVGVVDHRVPLYALFTGLVAASVVVVIRQVRGPVPRKLTVLAGCALVTFVLLGAAPATVPATFPFVVASGAIGISALVLPGISGASLLVILGQYETVIGAIGRFDLAVLAPFALGALVGLMTVVRVLHVLLRRHRDVTLAALAGIMLGSLRRLWPWLAAPETGGGHASAVPVAPPSAWGGEGWLIALAIALLAFGGVLLLERLGARSSEDRFSPRS